MSSSSSARALADTDLSSENATKGFVTMRVCGQLFGISVLQVQDVLRSQTVARIPLAPVEIAGALNLRGRIVTVVDVRVRLGLPERSESDPVMYLVVENNDELYSLRVDSVGDVLNLPVSNIEKSPANINRNWREIASGVCKLDKDLLVILDVQALLTF